MNERKPVYYQEVIIRQLPKAWTAGILCEDRGGYWFRQTGRTRDEAIRKLRNVLVEYNVPFDFSDWEPVH
jgi:hypothetical protein